MKEISSVLSQNRLCTSHFFSHQYHSQTRARFILCQGLLKQSFLTLQLVIRQQDQEFDQQCILPVNRAAMAVSDKWSSHITYYKCHNSHHHPNSAYSFSHPSILKYLRSTQTDKERPLNLTIHKILVTRSGTSKAKPRTNLF